MTRAARLLPLAAALASVLVVSMLFRSEAGPTVATTAPLPQLLLAEATVDPTPRGFVQGFADALNASDLDGVLANLNPDVGVLYMPGVAGIANPTPEEIREAFESYRILDATLMVDDCAEQPGLEGTEVLDCTLIYNSNFARGIGVENPQVFMRFVVGASGINAMYLSPFVRVDTE